MKKIIKNLKLMVSGYLFGDARFIFDAKLYTQSAALQGFWVKHPFIHHQLTNRTAHTPFHPLFELDFFLRECEKKTYLNPSNLF